MIDLNDKNAIAILDRKNVYASINGLAKQCRQAWEETQNIDFPGSYRGLENIVLCGMGGSAYAAYFIKALFSQSLAVPFELVNGYDLPSYVNEHTLVMLSSYSGSTEETITCGERAREIKAKITAVTSGLKLLELTKTHNLPAYTFNPLYNPSGQPRLGQGYMIIGHIGILARLGFLTLSNKEVSPAIDFLEKNNHTIGIEAKNVVEKFVEKIPVIVASGHLSGNAHVLRNQFNETAKNFSAYSLIPELNHHLMEGLAHPTNKTLLFLFLRSLLYNSTIQKRFEATKEVIAKNGIDTVEVNVLGDTPFAQMLWALSFGGYLTFYLAIIYNQDPSLIPWVDYFKRQLKK